MYAIRSYYAEYIGACAGGAVAYIGNGVGGGKVDEFDAVIPGLLVEGLLVGGQDFLGKRRCDENIV